MAGHGAEIERGRAAVSATIERLAAHNADALAASQPATLTPGLTTADADRIADALDNSQAANTTRAYASQWARFTAWADGRGVSPLPVAPDALAAYFVERAEDVGMASIRQAAAAIGERHKAADVPNPCQHEGVRRTLAGLSRIAAKTGRSRQRQVSALDSDALAAIRATAPNPRKGRRRMETPDAARERALLDIALCGVLSDGGLRRSEAAALTWADIQRQADGSGRVRIVRSKTDQAGAGAVVAVTRRTLADVEAIRRGASDAASVFGLSADRIGRRVKAAAMHAGLGSEFGGHSGRVGHAVRMTRGGASTHAVMRSGRWKSAGMVAAYTRNEDAGEALRYL